jgi:hypothetical protein
MVNDDELEAFLACIHFCRKNIEFLSTISAPLYTAAMIRMVSKHGGLWGHELDSYHLVLKLLYLAPPLAVPNFARSFKVHCFSSKTDIDASIVQRDICGHTRNIEYASRSLIGDECEYNIIEKECLATVWAITTFQPYVSGQPYQLTINIKTEKHQIFHWLHSHRPVLPRHLEWLRIFKTTEETPGKKACQIKYVTTTDKTSVAVWPHSGPLYEHARYYPSPYDWDATGPDN